jgi:hypothetical protein
MNRKIISIIFVSLFGCMLKSQSISEIAKSSINSTVSVIAVDNFNQPLSYGSGFIIGKELVATNVHIIAGCKKAYILSDGKYKKLEVNGYVAIDSTNDLIILKIIGLNDPVIELESNRNPEIGDRIYAVGNPKGLNGTFSEGIISGFRDLASNKLIQITAPISPGSSGGPVINTSGQVIGIAFASYIEGQNLNFAIPVKYLIDLELKMAESKELSSIKAKKENNQLESAKVPFNSNGVELRNIEPSYNSAPTMIFFSIKNNLEYSIKDIKIIFLVYDETGTIVDYNESTYFSREPIKPFLAKTIDFFSGGDAPQVALKKGYKIEYRVLDYKIIEN